MRRALKSVVLIFCLGVAASCSKKEEAVFTDPVIDNPISDFTATPDDADAFNYNFKSLSKNAKTLEWRFGDDTLSTEANPSHVYSTTGKYTVDLRTISASGSISHKYLDINVLADNIMQVTAAATGNANELKFTATVKAPIKTITWTINDVDPAKSTTKKTVTNELSPVHTFAFGSFNSFTCTVVTDKGSTVTITRNVTPAGIATDISLQRLSYTSTNVNLVQTGESADKLSDGNPDTKFGYYKDWDVKPQCYTMFYAQQQVVKLYAIENGNDSGSDRDPKEWFVEGSNDGITWDVLDHQILTIGFADYLVSIGQSANQYKRFFYYPIANPAPYTQYRWRIEKTFKNAFQIEEFRIYK